MAGSYTVKGDGFVTEKPRVWAMRAWLSLPLGSLSPRF
jgi:hypothetical protein